MTHEQRLTLWRLALALALTFAIVMALIPNPPQIPFEPNDKIQHMSAFGTLTVLMILAYPRMPLHLVGERLSFLGALIEVTQSIPALHRDCDIMDWIADTSVIIGVLVVVIFVRNARAAP